MNKKFLCRSLIAMMVASSVLTLWSCDDHLEEFENIQTQIDELHASLDEIQALINSGSVITNVEESGAGVKITLSNGQSYLVKNGQNGKDGVDGKDGVNGQDGEDAVVWTIGDDGYWYRNGEKTSYKAIGIDGKDGKDGINGTDGKDGVDGKDGIDGKDGKDGADGKDGIDGKDGKDGVDGKDGIDGKDGKDGVDGINGEYYVPNQETGCWDVYRDGELIRSTQDSWRGNGITAVASGRTITFYGVEGTGTETGEFVINLGEFLGSVAFIPTYMDAQLPYPTTTEPFYHVPTLNEDVFDYYSGRFNYTNKFVFNDVDMAFRLNPSEAYVAKSSLAFVNRNVTTRATGDDLEELDVIYHNIDDINCNENGALKDNELIVTARFKNVPKNNITALQVWIGQAITTSDYIAVRSEETSRLVIKGKGCINNTLYARNYVINNQYKETSKFIQETNSVGLNENININLKYDNENGIDLYNHVALYRGSDKIEDMGFEGRISYKFSLPADYYGSINTDEQDFVKLEDGVIKPNGYGSAAIGRKPVVRCDAMIDGKLVASAYIKLQVVDKDPVVDQPMDDIVLTLDEKNNKKEFIYQQLVNQNNGFTSAIVGEMPLEDVNKKIIAEAGLSSEDFWNYYGGANDTYKVKLEVAGQYSAVHTNDNVTSGTVQHYDGIDYVINLNNNATSTSQIKVGINNLIKTQLTAGYTNVENKGAKYTFTITIPSDDKTLYPDFVLQQVFYVKSECKPYQLNPISIVGNNSIKVNGDNVSGEWVMHSLIKKHFANPETFFDSYRINNVNALDFNWKNAYDNTVNDLSGIEDASSYATLEAPIYGSEVTKTMRYTQTMVNGETYSFEYDLIFINPFKAKSTNGITIEQIVGTATGDVKPEVEVVTNDGELLIFSFNPDGSKKMGTEATERYKLNSGMVDIKFSFNNNEDYRTLKANINELNIDENTGEITVEHGDILNRAYNLNVTATITFEDLSVVTCTIPVVIDPRQ